MRMTIDEFTSITSYIQWKGVNNIMAIDDNQNLNEDMDQDTGVTSNDDTMDQE